MKDWFEQGQKHIWLPYTQMQDAPQQLKIKKAKGCYIELDDGQKLLDGIASWWSMAHGYNHPYIRRKTAKQLRTLPHAMLAGLANEPAYKLAARLVKFANRKNQEDFSKIFFSDSGSTAVEVALKMAVQFHINQGDKSKAKFICFKNSYHGDTMGGMSLADPDGSMHAKFSNFLPRQLPTALPTNEKELKDFEYFVKDNAHIAAGIIIEPLVQCAGGMKFHNPKVLDSIVKIAQRNGLIVIFDECATGFYRTGKKFAFHEIEATPDILVVGKALTGGTVTLAATLTNDKIYNSFLDKSLDKALMHGPTFMGNPLAAAAANASLDLFEKHNYERKAKRISKIFDKELSNIRDYGRVIDTRAMGAIAVIEIYNLTWDETLMLREEFTKHNVWLRPFAGVIYLMPPLTISKKEIQILFDAIKNVIEKLKDSPIPGKVLTI